MTDKGAAKGFPTSAEMFGCEPDESGVARVDGLGLYYEVYGKGREGTPLLLIEGLGYSRWMWFKQVGELSWEYRLIVFDNRGVGESDKPQGYYTIEGMARDAALLLRALGEERVNVLGASMGGFIAEQLALDYPDRVDRLVLVSTTYAGSGYGRPDADPWGVFTRALDVFPAALEFTAKLGVPPSGSLELFAPFSDPRVNTKKALSLGFTKEYLLSHWDEIERIVEWRLARPQPHYAWKNQFAAGLRFDASHRVGEIASPTLVVAGSRDLIVPPRSAEALARKIPNSEFALIEDVGHLLFIERAREFNSLVFDFLSRPSPEPEPPAPAEKRPWWRRFGL